MAKLPMKLESNRIEDYLAATDVIDWTDPAVTAKAKEIAGHRQGEVDKARHLFLWVRDAIPHSSDIGNEVVTCKASEVLREGTGICYAKSHLLAALLRAQGIPAGFCYQVLCQSAECSEMVLHGLNGICLGTLGKWIRGANP